MTAEALKAALCEACKAVDLNDGRYFIHYANGRSLAASGNVPLVADTVRYLRQDLSSKWARPQNLAFWAGVIHGHLILAPNKPAG